MSAPRPRPIHVERTDDPSVLRWVVHHPVLNASGSGRRHAPHDSPLGRLAADGSITDLTIRCGDALIRTNDPSAWPLLAPTVQAALLVELDRLDAGSASWMLDTDTEPDIASIADLQAIVDRSAGPMMSNHGGAMVVTSADSTTVHLRASGACHGCHQTDDTLLDLIAPAIRAAYPGIEHVLVDRPDVGEPRSVTILRVLERRRR